MHQFEDLSVDVDFPAAPSGDGTRDDNCGLVSSSGMGGACCSFLGIGGGGCRCRQRASEVKSALPHLKQRLSTLNHSAIALCTMIDANPIPDDIVGASVLTALFLFIAMLYTHAS